LIQVVKVVGNRKIKTKKKDSKLLRNESD